MGDLLIEIGQNPHARRLIKQLGLPIPMPERLRRATTPWEERPLHDKDVVLAAGENPTLTAAVAQTLAAAGASPLVVGDDSLLEPFRTPGEAHGRPARKLPLGEELDRRADAIVFDASGIDSIAKLRALYDVFHPLVTKLARCGRVVVLGRPHEGLSPAHGAAQLALEGFVRSIAKEIGKTGSTAQLLCVEPGAEERLPAVLRFFLSPRSAFVSGQPIRISARVPGPKTIPWVQPLQGKIALVTGAARGIGAETARLLAAEGAHVVCLDRPDDDGPTSQLAREIGGSPLLADVSRPEAAAAIVDELTKRGGVDIVVHNAGITRDKTIARMSGEYWDLVLNVNLDAVIRMTDAILAGPMRQGGRIICLSSIAGIAGNVGQTNYAASKAGIIGFIKSLAPAVVDKGITVNAIAPGFIETRLTAAVPVAIREVARRMSNVGQGGLPKDVGEMVVFLASPGAVGITGSVIRTCGGAWIGA
ncbi:MAG: 3-oxoacyl-ACP reductase [Deltaproteobacteria bacterium]|nr:3-oxoacyl-ACP reductase [Deltaproteobacteria bacterium]